MVFDHHHLIGDVLNVADNVGGENDDFRFAQLRQNVTETHPLHRVKSRRRLVENDDLRVVHQGIGNADALNHAAGEFLHLLARYVAQAYPFEQLLAAFLCDSGINAVERRHIGEELHGGIVAVIAEFLRQVADQFTVTAVERGDIFPVPENFSAVGVKQRDDHFNERGLSRAVWGKQSVNPSVKGEIHVFEYGKILE